MINNDKHNNLFNIRNNKSSNNNENNNKALMIVENKILISII